MSVQRTLALVKPTCFAQGNCGEVIGAYESVGVRLVSAQVVSMRPDHAAEFYAEHRAKPFFQELCDYIASGPILVMALEGEDAIARVRAANGDTNPGKADPESLRGRFGRSLTQNAVHSSASEMEAERELALFFGDNITD